MHATPTHEYTSGDDSGHSSGDGSNGDGEDQGYRISLIA